MALSSSSRNHFRVLCDVLLSMFLQYKNLCGGAPEASTWVEKFCTWLLYIPTFLELLKGLNSKQRLFSWVKQANGIMPAQFCCLLKLWKVIAHNLDLTRVTHNSCTFPSIAVPHINEVYNNFCTLWICYKLRFLASIPSSVLACVDKFDMPALAKIMGFPLLLVQWTLESV